MIMAEVFDPILMIPDGWGFAPESAWLDFTESESFSAELVPAAIKATAQVGTTYRNPATGVTLQKQPSGRWKKTGSEAKSPLPGSDPQAPPTRYPERTSDSITIGFGRFNPPTIGHQKLIEHIAKVAKEGGSDYNIFGSHSQDPKKNPLSSGAKTSYMKEMFPDHADNVIYDQNVKSVLDALEGAHKRGYKVANVVVDLIEWKSLKRLQTNTMVREKNTTSKQSTLSQRAIAMRAPATRLAQCPPRSYVRLPRKATLMPLQKESQIRSPRKEKNPFMMNYGPQWSLKTSVIRRWYA